MIKVIHLFIFLFAHKLVFEVNLDVMTFLLYCNKVPHRWIYSTLSGGPWRHQAHNTKLSGSTSYRKISVSSSKELNLTETEFVGFVFRMDLDLSLTIQASDEIICHWQEVAASPHGLLPGSPVAQSADDLGPLQREGRQGPDSGHPGHYRGQAVNLRDISEKYIVKQ